LGAEFGLTVDSTLDERTYVKGRKVKNTEMASLDITGDPVPS
jgi:hypothetical protein